MTSPACVMHRLVWLRARAQQLLPEGGQQQLRWAHVHAGNHSGAKQQGSADSHKRASGHGSGHHLHRNAAESALAKGTSSSLVEFQVGVDEAVARFDSFQASSCRGFHMHGLLSPTGARIMPVYLPFWAFEATVTAEYKGLLGFKDKGSGQVAWKEQEDWATLAQRQPLSYVTHPELQVYASFKYSRQLGQGSGGVGPEVLGAARPLSHAEAATLSAAAGAAAAAPSRVKASQVAPPEAQQPIAGRGRMGDSVSGLARQHGAGGAQGTFGKSSSTSDPSSSGSSSSESSGSSEKAGAQGAGPATASTTGSSMQESSSQGKGRQEEAKPKGPVVTVHPPDMRQPLAWQLAWRAIMKAKVAEAVEAAKQTTGAAEARDMHVSLKIHSRSARLVYLPAYIAHYEAGTRHKAGTSTVIVPQTFYAAISGLKGGKVIATSHVSPAKVQLLAGASAGLGLPALTNAACSLFGAAPWVGPVEGLTAAVVVALVAGVWARGLPAAAQNAMTAQQVAAEREFFAQYDARETKTAAAVGAATGAFQDFAADGAASDGSPGSGDGSKPRAGPGAGGEGEAASGMPVFGSKAGELADEYMQWLWMDHDWGKWEGDEPWNWEERARWAGAEAIARRVGVRRVERTRFVLRLLADRDRRDSEASMEEERLRSGGSAGARGRAHRHHRAGHPHYGAHGHNAADPYGGQFSSRRRRDFLGYYKLLGLLEEEGANNDGELPEITTEQVKVAFKSAALRLHPDRVQAEGGDTEAQREAAIRFHKLQVAYDVLRDPEKRRAYDRGQWVGH